MARPPSGRWAPEDWAAWVGTYEDPYELGTIEVSIVGDDLVAHIGGWNAMKTLQPVSWHSFVASFDWGDLGVAFEPDGDGRGEYLVTRAGVGRRVER